MPRKYDMSLLDNMKKGQYKTNYKDVDVLVKPIPEGGKMVMLIHAYSNQ